LGEVQCDFVDKTAPAGLAQIRLHQQQAEQMRRKHGYYDWISDFERRHAEHRNDDVYAIVKIRLLFCEAARAF
jgi:hypothetical protein